MECFVSFLFLFVLCLFVAGSTARAHSRRARRKRAYLQLASRFAGSYIPGGILSRPQVRLRYGETFAFLREAKGRGAGSGRSTQIVIHWPDQAFRCELLPRSAEPCGSGFWRLKEIPLGDDSFAQRYVVCGTDRQSLRDFFSEGVRRQIERLYELFSDGSLYVLIRRGRILVQKRQLLRQLEPLEQFVQHALELYDQAMLTRERGIEFLAGDEAHPLEHVVCKVCGEEIASDLVFCRRCKTPHHADCWRFSGVCSVYGCGEKAFLAPQTAQLIGDPHALWKRAKPR